MLAGAHATYELKENIMYEGMRARSWRRALEVHVGVSAGRLGVKRCLPKERKAGIGSLSLVKDTRVLAYHSKLVGSRSRFPNESEVG